MTKKWVTVATEPANLESNNVGRMVYGTYGKMDSLDGAVLVQGRGRPKAVPAPKSPEFEFSTELRDIQIAWS